jgi:antitoxin component YwqK of YwqJK toxin-antitoxin module
MVKVEEEKIMINVNETEDGPYTEYWDNGNMMVEGNYKDGKPQGIWTEYYEDGQKHSEGGFKDGKRDGDWKVWVWECYATKNKDCLKEFHITKWKDDEEVIE